MQPPDYFHTSSELSSILGRLSIADQDPPPVDVHELHDEERSVVVQVHRKWKQIHPLHAWKELRRRRKA
jgi:hypothetical protein